jgi:hypothetical protein
MTPTQAPRVVTASFAVLLLLAGVAAAQSPATSPQAGWMDAFSSGLKRMGLLFSDFASLSNGPSAGELWRFDVKTGQRRRIGAAGGLSWPAPAPDGSTVYALRGGQAVRVAVVDGKETPVGAPAHWRKLIGVDPKDGTLVGLIEDAPFPRPALLHPNGERTDLPPPSDGAERKEVGVLMQEARSYADGASLEVRDSERGGRGRDVFLVEGSSERNVSDCGDDLCGQPARSADGAAFFYIRSARP